MSNSICQFKLLNCNNSAHVCSAQTREDVRPSAKTARTSIRRKEKEKEPGPNSGGTHSSVRLHISPVTTQQAVMSEKRLSVCLRERRLSRKAQIRSQRRRRMAEGKGGRENKSATVKAMFWCDREWRSSKPTSFLSPAAF